MKLILRAFEIPAGTPVTKPTGQKEYEIHRDGFTFHTLDGKKVTMGEGVLMLQNESSFRCVKDDTELAIHFECTDDLISFVDEHLVSHK